MTPLTPLKKISGGLLALIAIGSLVPLSQALAEDTKGKWQFGFGLSYMATVDYIRSNADVAYATTERGPSGELASVAYVDERPDANILNQPSIRDDFKLDFSASYGLTRWFALEAAVSYLEAPVGNIEFFNRDVHQGLTGNGNASEQSTCGPTLTSRCYDYTAQLPNRHEHNSFLPVGQLREIPIHLSGLIRFRPESPLDPYIGAGLGYIMTKLTTASQFNERADLVSNMRVATASEGEFTINRCNREGLPIDVGCTDFTPGPLQAQVRNAYEWHAVGGVDYYATDHFSVYVDARYVWTSGALDIRTDGAHQVRFGVTDSGRLLVMRRLYRDNDPAYANAAGDPNHLLDPGDPTSGPYLWEDYGVPSNAHFQDDICPRYPPGHPQAGQSMCKNSGFLETEDKNMNGNLDTACDGTNNYCEDEGFLYRLLPGSHDIDEALRIDCPNCRHNQSTNVGPNGIPENGDGILGTPDDGDDGFDTEDANGNGYLDRFLVYGIDICTTPQGVGHPRCIEDDNDPVNPMTFDRFNFIWPEGCSRDPQTLGPFTSLTESGCPPFLPATLRLNNGEPVLDSRGNPIYDRPNVQTTVNDNAADTYIIQGGKIRMGGFSLGVGFKFTF
jgi:outer membrane protein W